MSNLRRRLFLGVLFVFAVHLYACAGTPDAPRYPHDICEIFRENRDWYESAYDSRKKWGVPISVMMAIMHQESKYEAKAKPPRTTCLCILPGPRPSSAFGYPQALDSTWENYKRCTGNRGADRDDFGDSIDFIGWYCSVSHKQCGIAKTNAYSLYLAYHEGQGGFNRRTYQKKAWLKRVAGKVQSRAETYQKQLARCESEFQRRRGWGCLWPF